MMLHVRHSGVWKGAGPFVRHAGVWKVPLVAYARHKGLWKPVAQAISWVDVSPESQGAFYGGSGVQITAAPRPWVPGIPTGYGPLTYQWSIISGPGVIVSGDWAVATVNSNAPGTTRYRCRVTDALTGQFEDATAEVEWT